MPQIVAADTGEPVHLPEKDEFSVTVTFEWACECDWCRAHPPGVRYAPRVTLSEWPQKLRENPGRTARLANLLRQAAEYLDGCADIPMVDWPLPNLPKPEA